MARLYLCPPWFEQALASLLKLLGTMTETDEETGASASLAAKCASSFLSLMPIVGAFHAADESFTFDPVSSWEREFYHSELLGNACFGTDFLGYKRLQRTLTRCQRPCVFEL